MGYLVNEFEMPKLAKPKNKLRFLTIDEESRLLEELSPFRKSKGLNGIDDRSDDMQKFIQDNYDFAVLCLDTGCRFSEMANLKWENVDLETGEVHLYRTKTKNQTTLYLTNRAWDILRTRFETKKTSYIFTNKSGEGAKYTTNGIKTAFARAGMPECSVHTLRHTFASRLVQSGVSIQEVQLMLGHSKIATTMIYAHLEQSKTTKKVRDVLNNIHTQQQVA
jgi:integrase